MTIINAKDKQLTYTGLPQVGEVLPSWFQPLTFDVITKTVVNYEVAETKITISTQGVRQPMSAQQLQIKPEGQRAWKWETKVDDIIIFDGVKYRVAERWNWSEYGYLEYHICQAYENNGSDGGGSES